MCYLAYMANYRKQPSKDTLLKKLFRYFIQGLVILAPVAITAYILYIVFDWVDGLLRPAVFTTPGVGFILIIAFIILIGWMSSYFIMGSVINFFDHWLERTPGISLIYKAIKDFFSGIWWRKKEVYQSCTC